MTAPTVCVHRGSREIGGNCVELRSSKGERLVLDVGRPLDAAPDSHKLLPSSLILSGSASVLISHSHQDHWGLLGEVPDAWPVHCGKASERLIRITARLAGAPVERRFETWSPGISFDIGSFRITPELTDHSAFDAYMLKIEVDGKTIVYSGDFRLHGRKSALVRRLMAQPLKSVDLLILEGTNLASAKPTIDEAELEDRFALLFAKTPGRNFVAWSAQNIDRTVTLYRAAKRAGRTLVVDLYTAEVLEALADFGRIPQPGWDRLKVVVTRRFAQLYRHRNRGDFVDRMAAYGVSAAALATRRGEWVVMTRRSLIDDFIAAGAGPAGDDSWSWSMWSGYLSETDGRFLQDTFDAAGSAPHHLHTSGHASEAGLKAFASALSPKVIVPVHGVAWDAVGAQFQALHPLKDGEEMVI